VDTEQLKRTDVLKGAICYAVPLALASIGLWCSDPVRAEQPPQLEMVVLGSGHACALDDEGGAWCWGRNAYGQLGDGTTENSPVPVRVIGGMAFSVLAAGGNMTCGLTAPGAGYCWGLDLAGGPYLTGTPEPRRVDSGSWTSISVGFAHVCGIRPNGRAYCWGTNDFGQLGTGDTTSAPMFRLRTFWTFPGRLRVTPSRLVTRRPEAAAG
jgi:alpha-tubulin suppressor-like RCC1 family protein